jgi:GTPase
MTDEATKSPTRSGFIALIGAPNAGKSTLVNQLVGAKVSIVTHKVQTTRALIRGIATVGNTQLVLMDTPGVFAPKRRLDRAMVTTAWSGARDADIVLVLIDARKGIRDDEERILDMLPSIRQPKWLVLNKVDTIEPPKLLELAKELNERADFAETFMISALKGSGCDDLSKKLAETVPEGPWYYPEDQISDLPMRQLAAEITREKLYLRLHQELPYSSTVETETWEEKKDGSVKIEQVIYVERDSQKKIVLGRKGETIKAIGQAARKEISEILEQPVHLFLFVKVRENWGNDPERYREMGLDFSAD